MSEKEPNLQDAVDGLDAEKRATLAGLAKTPFAIPVVSTFAMMGLSVASPADAASSTFNPNQTK
jgi:hypothetical protein